MHAAMHTGLECLARRTAVAATGAAATASAPKAATAAAIPTTTAATGGAFALVAATATTACAAIGHHVHAGAHRVRLAARCTGHARLAGEVFHGRVAADTPAPLVGACVMRAWGLVFVGHGTVVVPWEASVAGKTGVTRGAIRAIAVGALAPWAIATAAIRAGAASC